MHVRLRGPRLSQLPRENVINPSMKDSVFYAVMRRERKLPDCTTATWRVLDLPHDWSVEDLPSLGYSENGAGALWGMTVAPTRTGPFDTELSQGGRDTGWFVGGTGWYRRSFSASAVPVDGQVEITFDGVYRNSDVWLNGELFGTHPYGYTTFSV